MKRMNRLLAILLVLTLLLGALPLGALAEGETGTANPAQNNEQPTSEGENDTTDPAQDSESAVESESDTTEPEQGAVEDENDTTEPEQDALVGASAAVSPVEGAEQPTGEGERSEESATVSTDDGKKDPILDDISFRSGSCNIHFSLYWGSNDPDDTFVCNIIYKFAGAPYQVVLNSSNNWNYTQLVYGDYQDLGSVNFSSTGAAGYTLFEHACIPGDPIEIKIGVREDYGHVRADFRVDWGNIPEKYWHEINCSYKAGENNVDISVPLKGSSWEYTSDRRVNPGTLVVTGSEEFRYTVSSADNKVFYIKPVKRPQPTVSVNWGDIAQEERFDITAEVMLSGAASTITLDEEEEYTHVYPVFEGKFQEVKPTTTRDKFIITGRIASDMDAVIDVVKILPTSFSVDWSNIPGLFRFDVELKDSQNDLVYATLTSDNAWQGVYEYQVDMNNLSLSAPRDGFSLSTDTTQLGKVIVKVTPEDGTIFVATDWGNIAEDDRRFYYAETSTPGSSRLVYNTNF